MNRPYTASSPYSLTPTERIRTPRRSGRYDRSDSYGRSGNHGTYGDYDEYGADRYGDPDTDAYPPYSDDDAVENYDEFIDEARIDRRWMWIAGVAGAILFVAVITASMILGGGDSGSVSATVVSQGTSTSAAPTPSAAPTAAPRAAAPAPSQSLPAETVTTLTPTPTAQTPTPAPAAPVLPAPQAAPPPPAVPGAITYRITGNRQLLDLVTVIYTDQRGALQTEVNVALPWSKTVVLDPGVSLSSVTATSVGGQLNCSITDANGALIAAQNSNTMITNCTR